MRQSILVIDDSRTITSLVIARLKDEAVDVLASNDGRKGYELARVLEPDLILLDVEMPVTDGYTICRQLKSDPKTMNIPVVFLTGATSSEEKIKGLDLGAIDYITKPFDPAELRARVRASLRTKFLLDLLAKKAQIDGLTGLWNRGHFDQRLASELALSKRTGDPLACMMIDVDLFKQTNDQYGHPVGDEVIRQVGQILSDCVRLEDIVCRYGGEEFAILMPNTTAERAVAVAERMRHAIADAPLTIKTHHVPVTCSFGVASTIGSGAIVAAADDAIYRAKRNGRNRVETATPSAIQPAA